MLVLLISASVSTLASITITASTTLTMDFLQAKLFKQMAQEKAGLLAKAVAAAFIAVSFLIANTETPILDMMSYSWGVISGSFMAPYLISLYWKKLSRAGAWAGMLAAFSPPARRSSASCSSPTRRPRSVKSRTSARTSPVWRCSFRSCSACSVSLVKPGDGTDSGFYAQPAAAPERKG